MWQKFGEEEERRSGITMSEIFSPMLTPTPLEATISECSLELKPSDVFTPKLRRRCLQTLLVVSLMLIPIIGFMLFLEWRRMMIMENPELLIVNGSFHLANSACGPVQGMAIGGGFEFRGVPYAIPPTDNLYPATRNKNLSYKWEPARNPFRHEHCWKDVLPYPQVKPKECLQFQHMKNNSFDVVGSEDCLTLDIFTPFIGYDTPSPVVVVIAIPTLFGGWTDQNHAELARPTAALAKEKGVVFVVPRFRLGPLGFMPRSSLNDTSSIVENSTNFQEAIILIQKLQLKLEKSYNLGLTDIAAALMWVNTNIEHFGGDASLVTLLGWGAGAHLVTTFTSLKPSKGYPFLFTQAWVTGNPLLPVNLNTKNESSNSTKLNYEAGYDLWDKSPCHKNGSKYDPLCIFGLPPRSIFESVPVNWLKEDGYDWLIPDNFVYRESAEATWSRRDPPNDFPFVIGTAAHGAISSVADGCQSIHTKAINNFESLNKNTPDVVSKFKSHYQNSSEILSKISIVSDIKVTCPSLRLARTADKSFNSGVFFYITSFEETIQCNQSTIRIADNLADLKAILGRYLTNDTASSQAASQLQNAFYYFVTEGALPGKHKRARQGIYQFGNQMQTLPSYPKCSNLILDN